MSYFFMVFTYKKEIINWALGSSAAGFHWTGKKPKFLIKRVRD